MDSYRAFAVKVAKMRAAQRAYFKDRTQSALHTAKFAERKVDEALEEIMKAQESVPQYELPLPSEDEDLANHG